MNVLLKIAYDGTNYFGFQLQKNVNTVQNEIEKSLAKIYKKYVPTILASRTDKGVHAIGQCVTFKIDNIIVPYERLAKVVNMHLPDDIFCNKAIIVPDDFHPRYNKNEKLYEYKILNNKYKIPQLRLTTHYCQKPLDFDNMNKAAQYFLGTHDFVGFSSKGSNKKNTVRTITNINLEKESNIIKLYIRGDGFLYNMVRIIAGTLIKVGLNEISYNDIERIILSKERRQAGFTASASGLTLMEIFYKDL